MIIVSISVSPSPRLILSNICSHAIPFITNVIILSILYFLFNEEYRSYRELISICLGMDYQHFNNMLIGICIILTSVPIIYLYKHIVTQLPSIHTHMANISMLYLGMFIVISSLTLIVKPTPVLLDKPQLTILNYTL